MAYQENKNLRELSKLMVDKGCKELRTLMRLRIKKVWRRKALSQKVVVNYS